MTAHKSINVLAAAALASSIFIAAPASATPANAALANAASASASQTAQIADDASSIAPTATATVNTVTAATNTAALSSLQQKRIAIIADNLVTRFATGGSNATITNSTMDAALALQQLAELSNGKLKASNLIDSTAMLKKMQADQTLAQTSGCGRLAKYLMGLNAAGVEQSSYQSYVDLLASNAADALAAPAQGYDARAYNAVWILPALLTHCPDQSALIEQAIAVIADEQTEDGLIKGDYQTTSQAVWALSKLDAAQQTSQTKSCIAKAVAALQGAQLPSGAWPYQPASSDKANLDTTSWAMLALSLADADAARGACTSAASYLQEAADSDLAHYTAASLSNEEMAAAAVLLGLTSAAKTGAVTLDPGTLGSSVGAYLTPSKASSLKAKSSKKRQIKVSWSNSNGKKLGVDGYQICVLRSGKTIKTVKVKGAAKSSKTIKDLTSGKKLSVYVRAYRAKNNHRAAVYSAKSNTVKVKVK